MPTEGRPEEATAAAAAASKPSPQDASTVAETAALVPATPLAGTRIKDRYLIERELGRGGFGVVYLARDEQLHGRRVVIKALLEQASDQSGWFSKKFREEREALSRLDHPGVVGVLDAGEMPDGKPFLAMQFVDGITLRAALRQLPGPMDLGRAGRLLRLIGQALSAAHERGVYHRDLKPENIMLQDLGEGEELVKIIDFGIATVKESQTAVTEVTRVAGSTNYIAPEQLLGKPSPSSDLYALGVIAYEMLTGQRPYSSESLAQMYLLQQTGVKVKPSELRKDLPEPAQDAILKALSFDAGKRHARARDFGEEMYRPLVGAGAAAPPEPAPRPKSKAGRIASVAAGVILTGAGIGLWVGRRPAAPPPVSAGPERSFSYSVLVQRYRDRKPFGRPFTLAQEMLFQADYRIRVVIRSSQAGHFYVFNEGPAPLEDGLPSYNVLFPGAQQPAALAAGQPLSIPPEPDWIQFDEQEGAEKLWMVWAAAAIPELEAVKMFASEKYLGAVSDRAKIPPVRDLLAKYAARPSEAVKDDGNQKTDIRGRGDILVRLLRLEHR